MISYLTTLRSASQNAEALRGTPGLSSLEKSLEIMRKVSINSRIVMLLTMTTMLLTMEIMIILSSTWLLSLRAAISDCFLHDLCRYLYSFIHSFIHSGHFYSAPSSPLLLRGAPDYSTDTVSEFHAEAHRQL